LDVSVFIGAIHPRIAPPEIDSFRSIPAQSIPTSICPCLLVAASWKSLFIRAFRGAIALGSFRLSEVAIRHGEYIWWTFLGMWIWAGKR
jgi:hypothetical protein